MNILKPWTIDPENYFELEIIKNQGLIIIAIQMSFELSNRNLEEASIEDFLDLYTDLNEVIHIEKNITVYKIFNDWLGYDFTHGNENFYYRVSIAQVYEYMLEYLYDCLMNTPTGMFTDLSSYQMIYEESLSEFKKYLPAEVDESDFIRSEIEKCFAVKLELEKPLYYIKYSRDSRNFNNFATMLESRMDKRISFLKRKFEKIEFTSDDTDKPVKDRYEQGKYSAKEIALAYLFDLYSKGMQLPLNVREGSLNKKRLVEVGDSRGVKGDTFYRSVLKIIQHDLNTERGLHQISPNWLNAVLDLSENNQLIIKYLRQKKLVE